jgi:hypothetical protein
MRLRFFERFVIDIRVLAPTLREALGQNLHNRAFFRGDFWGVGTNRDVRSGLTNAPLQANLIASPADDS